MTFNSLQYAIFLPVVLAIYWFLSRRAQTVLLLVASYVFYALWDWRFCGLLGLSTVTDYTVGRLMDEEVDGRRRKLLFLVSLAVNLGVLGFFKYFNFFTDSAAQLLDAIHLDVPRSALNIVLPIGISFYTFHGISYTFDVYRREIRATHDFLAFGVFVAFFPQLVAGPIGRAHLQLPQFETNRERPSGEAVGGALFLILLGLFKKVAIADALAPFVNQSFSASSTAGWTTLVLGTYAFALQIYGDFSGYSDIARGSARLLGIELPVNFAQPYLSRSVTEFWRRWHISLSNWLRDYLYVALGGNRSGRLATYRNLLIVMLLGGLWHGAAITFVIWGALHGLFLVAERATGWPRAEALDRPFSWRSDLFAALVTVQLVCLAWVFFRAESVGQALEYLRGVVTLRPGPVDRDALITLVAAVVAMFVIDWSQRRSGDQLVMMRWGAATRGLAFGALLLGIVIYSGGAPVPFIYFQF
jgi:D-alanyl-lipoteichoic acid acyltransferase DltB (MBOAT superfamily)